MGSFNLGGVYDYYLVALTIQLAYKCNISNYSTIDLSNVNSIGGCREVDANIS
jgi:hypothetical protein